MLEFLYQQSRDLSLFFFINFSKSASAKQGSSPGVTSLKTLTAVKVSVSIPEKAAASQRPTLKSCFLKAHTVEINYNRQHNSVLVFIKATRFDPRWSYSV